MKYKQWIEKQPSAISGQFSEYVNGEGKNIACHVKRASTGGIAYKGNDVIPMMHEEHMYQHKYGELALLQKYRSELEIETVEEAKDWFDKKAAYYHTLYRQQN